MKVRLGDICEILNGYAFKSSNYVKDGVRIIRISNVQKGFIEDSFPVFYPKDDKYAQNYALIENDLLISLTGNVGRVALLSCDLLPAALNQRVACIRIKNRHIVLTKYLFHLLNSDRFEQSCITSAQGIAQKNMSTNWLQQYEIAIVPLEIQSKIINVLDTLDNLISHRKEQLLKLAQIVKSRFIEMFGDIITNSKNWDIQPLGELCTIVRGGSPRPIEKFLGGDIPWIKIGDATKGDSIYIHSTQEHIIEAGVSKSRFIKAGSLIFANCGVSLGFARITTFDGCIHDGWLAMDDISTHLNKVFLLKSLNQITEHFRKIAPAGTQPNLNTAIMKAYKQVVPPLPLQQQFAAFVEKVDKSKFIVGNRLAGRLYRNLLTKLSLSEADYD